MNCPSCHRSSFASALRGTAERLETTPGAVY